MDLRQYWISRIGELELERYNHRITEDCDLNKMSDADLIRIIQIAWYGVQGVCYEWKGNYPF